MPFGSSAQIMSLLPKRRFNWFSGETVFVPWTLGFKLLAFTLSASPCGRVLATPVSPHAALPTCSVHSRVSLSAKSVGLVGFWHLPTEFSKLNSIPP